MLQEQPFFMTNEEWYYHDKKKNRFFLTDKAPKEAQESYKKYYEQLDEPDPVFLEQVIKDAELYKRNELKKEGKTDDEIEKEISDWKNAIAS